MYQFPRLLCFMSVLDHHLEVIRAIYAYLSLLRSQPRPFPPWHQDEIIQVSKIYFQYKEKQSPSQYVSRMAERCGRPYPRDKLLSANSVTEEWDEDASRDLLDNYLTVKAGRIMVMGREGWEKVKLVTDGSVEEDERVWEKEKWYGTEYLVRRLPQEVIQEVRATSERYTHHDR